MKKVRFLLLAAMVAMFTGCQKEVAEQELDNNKPTPTGDTRIIIEGEGMIGPVTRSSDGRVDFEGGYATGAGLYNGDARPTVAAYPDAGYEVNYFYGGPESEPNRYDYAQSSTSEFKVPLGGQDHKFRCGFKEKKRDLTVNAGTGGSVSPSGTNSYRVEKPISITATPNGGYEFAGWTVTEGDVTIENPAARLPPQPCIMITVRLLQTLNPALSWYLPYVPVQIKLYRCRFWVPVLILSIMEMVQ